MLFVVYFVEKRHQYERWRFFNRSSLFLTFKFHIEDENPYLPPMSTCKIGFEKIGGAECEIQHFKLLKCVFTGALQILEAADQSVLVDNSSVCALCRWCTCFSTQWRALPLRHQTKAKLGCSHTGNRWTTVSNSHLRGNSSQSLQLFCKCLLFFIHHDR